MKQCLLLLCLCLLPLLGYGQDDYPKSRVSSNGLVGFVNEDGKFIQTAKYSAVGEYNDDGYCWVAVGGKMKKGELEGAKYGYVDQFAFEVIPPIYDEVGASFYEGTVFCVRDGKYGLVNDDGKEVLPCEYEWMTDIVNGKVVVRKNGRTGVVDIYGNVLVDMKYTIIYQQWQAGVSWAIKDGRWNEKGDVSQWTVSGGTWGLIDSLGNELTPFKYQGGGEFYADRAIYQENGKWGLMDNHGNELTPAKYDGLGNPEMDGRAYVVLDGKYGWIDNAGKVYVEPTYSFVISYRFGMSMMNVNGKYGFLDREGNVLVPAIYDAATMVDDNGYSGVNVGGKMDSYGQCHGGKWGFVDSTGRVCTQIKYDELTRYSEDKASARIEDMWGIIDNKCNEVSPFKYNGVSDFENGYARVNIGGMVDKSTRSVKGGKWGYVDSLGKEICEIKYEGVGGMYDGNALVQLNGKWGFINSSGKEITPIIYTGCSDFKDGMAYVCLGGTKTNDKMKGGKWGWIDVNGNPITEVKYDLIGAFHDGLALVRENGKFGFIDRTGKEIVPVKYDAVSDFKNGRAWVNSGGVYNAENQTVTGGDYAWIDTEGKYLGVKSSGNFSLKKALGEFLGINYSIKDVIPESMWNY